MASDITYTYAQDVDLDQGTKYEDIPKLVKGDTGATTIALTCKRGAAAADISGATCSAHVINASKQTIAVSGSIAANVASFVLSGACLAVQGKLEIIVLLTEGAAVKPIYKATTSVASGETDEVVDPEDIVIGLTQANAIVSAFSSWEEYNPLTSYSQYNHVTWPVADGGDGCSYMWNDATPSVAGTDPSESVNWLKVADRGEAGAGSPSDDNPLANGTAAPGTSEYLSRKDHVHPSDTAKAALITSPTNGHVVTTDGSGQPTDSGHALTEYAIIAPIYLKNAGNFTPALSEAGGLFRVYYATAVTVTIPTNASVAYPVGTLLMFWQGSAGKVTLSPAGGVTLQSYSSYLSTKGTHGVIYAKQFEANGWIVWGDIAA